MRVVKEEVGTRQQKVGAVYTNRHDDSEDTNVRKKVGQQKRINSRI